MMHPLMNRSEIRVIEQTLKELGKQKEKIHILEWGSGGSTLYFTDFLKKHNILYEWVSIEYNKSWYKKVKDAVGDNPNIHIKLFDVGNNHLKQRNTPMDEYVAYPTTLSKQFDMVLVDGRKRRRCMLIVKDILAPNGVVFLHDAQRRYYHCAMKEFPDRKFASMFLWRGALKEPDFFQAYKNALYSAYFRTAFLIFIAPLQWVKRKLLPWRKKYAKRKKRLELSR